MPQVRGPEPLEPERLVPVLQGPGLQPGRAHGRQVPGPQIGLVPVRKRWPVKRLQ